MLSLQHRILKEVRRGDGGGQGSREHSALLLFGLKKDDGENRWNGSIWDALACLER